MISGGWWQSLGKSLLNSQSRRSVDQKVTPWQPPVTRDKHVLPNWSAKTSLWLLWLLLYVAVVTCSFHGSDRLVYKHSLATVKAVVKPWKVQCKLETFTSNESCASVLQPTCFKAQLFQVLLPLGYYFSCICRQTWETTGNCGYQLATKAIPRGFRAGPSLQLISPIWKPPLPISALKQLLLWFGTI